MTSGPYIEKPWAFTPDQVILALQGQLNGLSYIDAQRRLMDAGKNILKPANRTPWYILFLQQFANPLVYILIGAAVVKAFFKGATDAAVIGAVLLFMAVIGFIQEMKARKAMDALLSLSAPKAKIRRDGQASLVDASELVPGDILILDAGDRVAADARLVEIANLRINESTFTGESLPVDKTVSLVPEISAIHDRKNMVFMGTTVSHGRALAVVTSTGMKTEIGRIAQAVSSTGKDKTLLQKNIDQLGNSLIWVVGGACITLAVAGLWHNMGWVDVLLLAVAAAVSGIPEGLPAAVTIVLAVCVSRMAARNVLIRKLTAVETLGTATVICSDKTGTLTLNQMTVRQIWNAERNLTVTGIGYEPTGEFQLNGSRIDPRNDLNLKKLLCVSALCNDAILSKTGNEHTILGDPTEGALLTAAAKAGLIKKEQEETHPRLGEIPFESEQQFMATLHAEGGQRMVYIKGSVEKLLPMCARLKTLEGERDIDPAANRAILEANHSMASQALRVLAIACAPYPVELGRLDSRNLHGRLVLLGLIGMIDPPREEARKAIQACKSAGVLVAMITGDNPATAAAIASQLEIGRPGESAIVGKDIENMDDDQLREVCRTKSVFARIEPLHKLRIVKAFKANGHIAAMTGDGVNDAPALEAASIGIAMGITGTDVAKEAADVVLSDDNFASIVAAVEEGRIIFNRLRNVVFFLLMTCTSELLTLFLSVAFYGESPLEPIQILWINLITGALVAIPLGLEPGTGRELLQPPRNPKVGLLFPGMIMRIGFAAILMSASVTWIFHHAPLPLAVNDSLAHEIRQTIVFSGIIVFEWFFAFQARSPEKGVFQLGLFRNHWLLICMFIGLSLQLIVIYLPVANNIFHTRPLNLIECGWTLLPAIVAVTLEAIRKKFFPDLFGAGQWTPWRKSSAPTQNGR